MTLAERAIPAIWGFHPYTDVDLRESGGITNFKNRAPSGARIWITEVGSRRDRNCKKNAGEPCNTETSQAGDIRTLMDSTIPNTGVERFYHYHWREPDSGKADGIFDSGLLNPDGTTREVYTVFKNRTAP